MGCCPSTTSLRFPFREELEAEDGVYLRGGSAIAAPDGSWLVEPVEDEERLIAADIDVATVRAERQNFDASGHYSRPDVFDVRVDRRWRIASTFADD